MNEIGGEPGAIARVTGAAVLALAVLAALGVGALVCAGLSLRAGASRVAAARRRRRASAPGGRTIEGTCRVVRDPRD